MANAVGLALDIFGLPALVALAASLVLVLLGRTLAPAPYASGVVLPWAFALSVVAGYALLPREWAAWHPHQDQPWQWLPYCGIFAAFAASVGSRMSSYGGVRWLVPGTAALAGAALLVPSWQVLGLGRWAVRCIVALYLIAICIPLLLPARPLAKPRIIVMTVAAAMLAVATGGMVSVRMAQLAAIAAGALAGCCVCVVAERGKPSNESVTSMALVFSVLVGGTAWTACVDPDPPQFMLLAFPLLPLALCVAALWSGRQVPREG
jgi:hypothetical protein